MTKITDTGTPALLEAGRGYDPIEDRLRQTVRATRPPALREAIPDLAEVSIGHGLAADALLVGFPEAVRRCLAALGD